MKCDKGDVFDEVVVVVREKKCTLEPRTRCSRREKPTCKQVVNLSLTYTFVGLFFFAPI